MAINRNLNWSKDLRIRLNSVETIDLFNQYRSQILGNGGMTSNNDVWNIFINKHLKEEILGYNEKLIQDDICEIFKKILDNKVAIIFNYVDSLMSLIFQKLDVENIKTNYLLKLLGENFKDINPNDFNNPDSNMFYDLDFIKDFRKKLQEEYSVWIEKTKRERNKGDDK